MLALNDVREADRWQPVIDTLDDASFCGAFGAVVRRRTRGLEHPATYDCCDSAFVEA